MKSPNLNAPLAERMRPTTLEGYIGQQHLIGPKGPLAKALESGRLPSIIFWGPPGVGKTTLAHIISTKLNRPFHALSAINSGVKDIRAIIDASKNSSIFGQPILFIDEIHRFSKSQQDSLLGAVETGVITLIGATTENPSFEVIAPLLSRCQVFVLRPLEVSDLLGILNTAITTDPVLKTKTIVIKEHEALLRISGGDARKLLNALELVVNATSAKKVEITDEKVVATIQQNLALYDKDGENHYNIISAFIKSMRGSDPNAAVYWLARMIEGGEDPLFIARRMVILASEDIGNANPQALVIATAGFQAVNMIGYPEARIILGHVATYLAVSPKSNAAYMGIEQAIAKVQETGDLAVPLHIRNAPTKLMKDLGYHKGYTYDHDYSNNFSQQEFLPDALRGFAFYEPGDNTKEREIAAHLKKLWGSKYSEPNA
jgi:putative ATPase